MDYETKNEMLRERLRKIAEIAEGALAGQPHEAEPCWEHLAMAFGRIETEIVIYATSDDGEKPVEPHINAADTGGGAAITQERLAGTARPTGMMPGI